ncbi:uncharacterized protein JCM10292_005838 [Rhodotorula paludigena]|uniref:uncharacterized protein n=1 Tax=Rhodotorula paludigena TaxID=86838 RepID=UPI00317FF776
MVSFPSFLPRGPPPPRPPRDRSSSSLTSLVPPSPIRGSSTLAYLQDDRRASDTPQRDGLVTIPLTPTSASLMRRAVSRQQHQQRSNGPFVGGEGARRQNEAERDRLQGLMRSDTMASRARSPRLARTSGGGGAEMKARIKVWLMHEGPRVLVFVLWLMLQLGVLAIGVIRYDMSSNFTQARTTFGKTYVLARATALVLHVDVAFLLLPICRSFITLMRRTPMIRKLPLDESVAFHRLVAYSLIFWVIVHVISHLFNSWWLAKTWTNSTAPCLVAALEINGTTGPYLTGWIMVAICLVMAWFATEKRRRKNFERFFYTHHLAIPFFLLWQLHGMFCMIRPDRPPFCSFWQIGLFWLFWLGGGAVYIVERVLREIRSRHRTYISKVIAHPGKTVELQIKKEKTTMRPGQYILLNCPAVSLWQWHPFTLTNAPEEDHLSVHFRVVGDWTAELAKLLSCELDPRDQQSKEVGGEEANLPIVSVLPRIMVDGPFGTASEDVLKYEVAVLVGAGIGVTPFASVLKHIWYRLHAPDGQALRLRKVYFFWICRDYASFEWFQSLLLAIEEQDVGNRIEIHTYLTGRIQTSDAINIVANDVGNVRDAVTQLKAPTHYGRPNWDRVFLSLSDEHPSTSIGCFFCGPKPLASTLHKACVQYSSADREGTRFTFSKERF